MLFQFHKVRLKGNDGLLIYPPTMFQFHKVRLKVEVCFSTASSNFVSIP